MSRGRIDVAACFEAHALPLSYNLCCMSKLICLFSLAPKAIAFYSNEHLVLKKKNVHTFAAASPDAVSPAGVFLEDIFAPLSAQPWPPGRRPSSKAASPTRRNSATAPTKF